MKSWKYRLTIYTHEETIIIEDLGCKGSVTRNLFSDSNRMDIDVYNLANETRSKIYVAPYTPYKDRPLIRLEAGFGVDNLSALFFGQAIEIYSSKPGGSTEIITHINAVCMDIFNMSAVTFEAGTSKRDAIKSLANDFPNLNINSLGGIAGKFLTPTTFQGNTLEQINKIAGGYAFIDGDQFNAVLANECVDAPVPVISSDTALLDTPIRKEFQYEVKMRMQPQLQVGQLLKIESRIAPNFNGQYKVIGFTHSFLFSESVAGEKTTQATLLLPEGMPVGDISTNNNTASKTPTIVRNEQIAPLGEKERSDVQYVLQYIKTHKGKIPNTKITNNISWVEMLGHSNSDSDRLSELNITKLSNVYFLAKNMQNILDKHYSGRGITITSAWRSVRNNSSCGGKANSKHLSGLAMDFKISGEAPSVTTAFFSKVWGGRVAYAQAYATFTHVQINNVKGFVNDR